MTRIVEVRAGILKKNDELARALRGRFERAGVFVVNLVSSPGSGKTAFLEHTLRELQADGLRVAALVGDLETDHDAQRLARSGAPARQINTHGRCHLEAEMIETHLADWSLESLDVLFIENVGNLVCPASYDLGEAMRVALLSVTEGEDKPLKYPDMFAASALMLVNKIDLLPYLNFDVERCIDFARRVNPAIEVIRVSATTGEGMGDWLTWIESRLKADAVAGLRAGIVRSTAS